MKRRRGRPVDGILILDKALEVSSNRALQRARGIYRAARAGHTGSLDPLASGVLPICFGEATKFSRYLLDADKRYRAEIVLGERRDTGDGEGSVIAATSAAAVSAADFAEAAAAFLGDIEQVPPMYSAIKRDGEPLYKIARRGEEVEREARKVTIYRLEVLDFEPGERARGIIDVTVSKGTYIRTIAEDIGIKLGVGGYLGGLRRLEAAGFSIDEAHTEAELQALRDADNEAALDALLLPVERALGDMPEVVLGERAGYYLLRGEAVQVSQAPVQGEVILRLFDGRFVGLGGILEDGRVAPRRLLASAAEIAASL